MYVWFRRCLSLLKITHALNFILCILNIFEYFRHLINFPTHFNKLFVMSKKINWKCPENSSNVEQYVNISWHSKKYIIQSKFVIAQQHQKRHTKIVIKCYIEQNRQNYTKQNICRKWKWRLGFKLVVANDKQVYIEVSKLLTILIVRYGSYWNIDSNTSFKSIKQYQPSLFKPSYIFSLWLHREP